MSDEILTISEAAAILKMTERQVYELTRRRSLGANGISISGIQHSRKGETHPQIGLDRVD